MTGQSGFAVVGYAVRFPGAADAREFWDVLAEGRDAVSEVPADRWDVDEFFDADPDAAGKMVSRRAGFVDDVAGFDAPFFGVSAREAMFMDPQHRLVLETAWSAVEHAGIAPEAADDFLRSCREVHGLAIAGLMCIPPIDEEAALHFASGVDAMPQIRSGRMRALAVAGERRSILAPDVLTTAEAGVPGLTANVWHGLLAPARTPPAIVDRLRVGAGEEARLFAADAQGC